MDNYIDCTFLRTAFSSRPVILHIDSAWYTKERLSRIVTVFKQHGVYLPSACYRVLVHRLPFLNFVAVSKYSPAVGPFSKERKGNYNILKEYRYSRVAAPSIQPTNIARLRHGLTKEL